MKAVSKLVLSMFCLALSGCSGEEAEPGPDSTATTPRADSTTQPVLDQSKPVAADPADPAEEALSFYEQLGGKIESGPESEGTPPVGIDLSGIALKAGDLDKLKALTSVRTLKLNYTGVTDAGIESLPRAEHITALYLNRAQITNKGIRHLAGLTGLRSLFLSETAIGDADMPALAELPNLSSLGLAGTMLTDAGLSTLAGMSSLKVLYLDNTAVSDAGLEQLKTLTGLQTLRLSKTAVTDSGIEQLQSALPKCNITK